MNIVLPDPLIPLPTSQVANDPSWKDTNSLEQHIKNLLSPSTPHFNTLYDPYREGANFVHGLRVLHLLFLMDVG